MTHIPPYKKGLLIHKQTSTQMHVKWFLAPKKTSAGIPRYNQNVEKYSRSDGIRQGTIFESSEQIFQKISKKIQKFQYIPKLLKNFKNFKKNSKKFQKISEIPIQKNISKNSKRKSRNSKNSKKSKKNLKILKLQKNPKIPESIWNRYSNFFIKIQKNITCA